ncbi:class I SAM-dependent methyltransferase [Bradyrhizobium sp. Pear76]|uniref:class I SAM-dependent methyltransferase n=1 Tax=Bradyrhizobium oropedii TaxID=1571201 RepID=UPI001E5AC134|nr:methyltransferase domain-containing protein [Bradyrhizobium oropedii]MCC8964196.1 class I SAM-dependent methyltransferase [Bradyrhizobium oropedii]
MPASDKEFVGSIPELYDRLLVPMIFEPYARDLAQRAKAIGPRDLLETAAGTGAVTRALSAALGRDTRIVATDLNEPMLERAKSRMPDAADIRWRQADALNLPFDNASFDVVACQFGAMFFPDKPKGYSEARRVLKPGGRFLFSMWDRIEENEFADVVTQALAEVFPADPPRFLARTPHGHYAADPIRADLLAAGFSKIEIDTVREQSRANAPHDPAIGFCQGSPLRGEIEARGGIGLDAATEHAASALARRFGKGAIEGRIQALVITAVA